jgi:hypothetical protein
MGNQGEEGRLVFCSEGPERLTASVGIEVVAVNGQIAHLLYARKKVQRCAARSVDRGDLGPPAFSHLIREACGALHVGYINYLHMHRLALELANYNTVNTVKRRQVISRSSIAATESDRH